VPPVSQSVGRAAMSGSGGGGDVVCGPALSRRPPAGGHDHHVASAELLEHCIPVSSADTRRHLRSANRHLLAVPRFRFNTYGCRAFSVDGSTAWNSPRDLIRDPMHEQHRLF